MIFHESEDMRTSFTVTSGYFHKQIYEGIHVKDGN